MEVNIPLDSWPSILAMAVVLVLWEVNFEAIGHSGDLKHNAILCSIKKLVIRVSALDY